MLLLAKGLESNTNPNHANKGDEVKNGGNHLITQVIDEDC